MGAKVGTLRRRKSDSSSRTQSSASFGKLGQRKEYKTGSDQLLSKGRGKVSRKK